MVCKFIANSDFMTGCHEKSFLINFFNPKKTNSNFYYAENGI